MLCPQTLYVCVYVCACVCSASEAAVAAALTRVRLTVFISVCVTRIVNTASSVKLRAYVCVWVCVHVCVMNYEQQPQPDLICVWLRILHSNELVISIRPVCVFIVPFVCVWESHVTRLIEGRAFKPCCHYPCSSPHRTNKQRETHWAPEQRAGPRSTSPPSRAPSWAAVVAAAALSSPVWWSSEEGLILTVHRGDANGGGLTCK